MSPEARQMLHDYNTKRRRLMIQPWHVRLIRWLKEHLR